MESIGGRETRRRDSNSSTDSWSVINRSTSAASTNLSSSISYCSSFRDGEQNEEHEDELSECDSDVSTEDSDLELEEDLSEVGQAEEAMENGESEEENEDMEEKESDDEEDDEEDEEEEKDEEEEDDQMSLVDEDEALENEAALRYVPAEKTSRRLDFLAKQFESPFDQWIGGERNRPFVFGSLLVCSAIGLAIVQIIGSTWLANLPRSAVYQGSMRGEMLLDLSPIDVGLQSRRLGRLQHFAPIHPLGTAKIESALGPNEKLSSPRSFTYGNCTREQLRKEWAMKAVKALIQWANNFTDNQCALREVFKGETLVSSPNRPIYVVPSISSPLPDFDISLKPSFTHRKIFRPTLSQSKRPTTERTPRPTQSPPPPPVSWRKRQQKPISTHSSFQQCPRLVSLGKRGEITHKMAPPPAVGKKYRHYIKTSDGFSRRSAHPQNMPKIAQKSTPTMPRSNPKFSKALFNRAVSSPKFTRKGPIPPPKESKKPNRPTAVQQYRPTKQHKPCKSRPEPCWNDFRMETLKSEKKEKTSLVLRKEYSLTESIQEKKQNPLRKSQRSEVCYGYSNTSTNIEKRGKMEKKRPTVQGYCSTISRSRSLSRVTEPQCDHRVWKNATKAQRKPKRPCLEHKKAVPCRENNKLDKQIRQQQKKRLRRN
ncbi:unnamed protein product, partial [Mesorhabditis belari]|uniref:Uncharacterized protein n=1 Tax=Mesorhabditis belari TaxID=2138241 RepID=A0AAF3F581_9BILA